MNLINVIGKFEGCGYCGHTASTATTWVKPQHVQFNVKQWHECTSGNEIYGGGSCCDSTAHTLLNVLNITQHQSTPDQKQAGVIDVSLDDQVQLKQLLTFQGLYDAKTITARVSELLCWLDELYPKSKVFLVGSMPPAANAILERMFKEKGHTCVYSVSDRICVETHQVDGSVKKEYQFKHLGFMVAE